MCRDCRQNCRGIRFDFQCKLFYHDYCKSVAYVKPDAVFFFNDTLHQPGFCGFDTWPRTVRAAIESTAPVFVTSRTHLESTSEFKKVNEIVTKDLEVFQEPKTNPYAETQPERNFSADDDDDPIIFKNQFYFIVRKLQDLIQL